MFMSQYRWPEAMPWVRRAMEYELAGDAPTAPPSITAPPPAMSSHSQSAMTTISPGAAGAAAFFLRLTGPAAATVVSMAPKLSV